jgi:hypothetical protein
VDQPHNDEMIENAVIDGLVEDSTGVFDDDDWRRTPNARNWKKKKKGRVRMSNNTWRNNNDELQLLLRYTDIEVEALKRTHWESGKRSRGRSRPALSDV